MARTAQKLAIKLTVVIVQAAERGIASSKGEERIVNHLALPCQLRSIMTKRLDWRAKSVQISPSR